MLTYTVAGITCRLLKLNLKHPDTKVYGRNKEYLLPYHNMNIFKKFLLRFCIYTWLSTVIFLSLTILLFGTVLINQYLITLFVAIVLLISYKFSVTETDKICFIKTFSNIKAKNIFYSFIFLFWLLLLLKWQIRVERLYDHEVTMIYANLLFFISLPGSFLMEIFNIIFDFFFEDDFIYDTMVLKRISIFLAWLKYFIIFNFQVYLAIKKLMVKWTDIRP